MDLDCSSMVSRQLKALSTFFWHKFRGRSVSIELVACHFCRCATWRRKRRLKNEDLHSLWVLLNANRAPFLAALLTLEATAEGPSYVTKLDAPNRSLQFVCIHERHWERERPGQTKASHTCLELHHHHCHKPLQIKMPTGLARSASQLAIHHEVQTSQPHIGSATWSHYRTHNCLSAVSILTAFVV